jgi:hypothetical protein
LWPIGTDQDASGPSSDGTAFPVDRFNDVPAARPPPQCPTFDARDHLRARALGGIRENSVDY